jgi:hypothetical protein
MTDPDGAAKPVRISRTAKGERPQNFSDPAIDKVLGITLSLASELSVLRERLDTLERLVEKQGVVSRAAIEAFEPTPAEMAARARWRAEYLDRVLQVVHRELDELQTGRTARPLDDVVADFAARRI